MLISGLRQKTCSSQDLVSVRWRFGKEPLNVSRRKGEQDDECLLEPVAGPREGRAE